MFKKIEGFGGKYLINEKGELFSKKTDSLLEPSLNTQGYVENGLYNELGKRINVKRHRLVAGAFLKKILGKNQVNHKNGIKNDNRLENLEWCTPSENIQHAIISLGKNFGIPKGTFPAWLKSKLNDEKVAKIRSLIKDGYSGIKIGNIFGVSDQTIYDIKSGRCWSKK